MHELEAKLKPICEMKETLAEWAKCELARGKDQVDTKEMGEVIDMIKDLAEAEEKCVKAAMYKMQTKAMKEEEEMGRMGYDNYRYASGRFAPKGKGSYRPSESGRRGYPEPAEGDWRPEYGPWGDMDLYGQMMGYGDGSYGGRGSQGGSSGSGRNMNRGGGSDGSNSGSMDGGRMGYTDPDYERIMRDDRHGRPYREWQLSRRHYTETRSEGDKKEMSQHAKEHMSDMVMSVKEMWTDADPELKAKMKADLTALMNEMK